MCKNSKMNTEMTFLNILLQWKCIKTADMIKTKFFYRVKFFWKKLEPLWAHFEPAKKLVQALTLFTLSLQKSSFKLWPYLLWAWKKLELEPRLGPISSQDWNFRARAELELLRLHVRAFLSPKIEPKVLLFIV